MCGYWFSIKGKLEISQWCGDLLAFKGGEATATLSTEALLLLFLIDCHKPASEIMENIIWF